MKKILILNASPRKNGTVSRMLDLMKEELESNGSDVTYIEVCKLQVRPCIACMKCRSGLNCVLPEDDAHRVAGMIRECDGLIVGTPTYWGNMNGQLKVLFDRMVYALMGEKPSGLPLPLHKGKKAVIVASCTTIWPFGILSHQSSGAVRAVKEVLSWSGFKCRSIQKCGTRTNPELSPRIIRKCRRMASAM